jgi:tetracycline resistance efflux pump
MMPIAIPSAITMNSNLPLVLASVLSGGVFGDHSSPISDTTIVSSMASACDHIDHVKTQLPYALTAASLALVFFIIFGFILN